MDLIGRACVSWRERNRMEKSVKIALLYDIYGSLLTKRQQEILEAHYYEDLSLSEIGENLGISKQAVSDQLKRATEKMEEWESILQVYASRKSYRTLFLKLQSLLKENTEQALCEADFLLTEQISSLNGGESEDESYV